MHADVDFFPVILFFRRQRPGRTDHFATKETGSGADELAVFWVRLWMRRVEDEGTGGDVEVSVGGIGALEGRHGARGTMNGT